MPKWVVPTIKLFGLFFLVHFIVFLVQSHAAAPAIQDGQYVLDNHGRVVKVLTASEYLSLKGAELRLFATGWMFFYFVPVVYWWFPRNRESGFPVLWTRTVPGHLNAISGFITIASPTLLRQCFFHCNQMCMSAFSSGVVTDRSTKSNVPFFTSRAASSNPVIAAR